MINWEWYDHPNTFRLFMHCLIRANHKEKTWRGHNIKCGEFITSYNKLASELGLTVKQIRVAIGNLERTNEVARKSTSQHTKIIVKNWDKYQTGASEESDKWSLEGQSKGNQRATNKNDKNDKNDKNAYIAPDDVVQLYNETLGKKLEYCRGLGSHQHLNNFLEATQWLKTKDDWLELFHKCENRSHLMGEDGGWCVSLTWLVNYDNALKVLNGNFNNNKKYTSVKDWVPGEDVLRACGEIE
jgi:hypothetical protein